MSDTADDHAGPDEDRRHRGRRADDVVTHRPNMVDVITLIGVLVVAFASVFLVTAAIADIRAAEARGAERAAAAVAHLTGELYRGHEDILTMLGEDRVTSDTSDTCAE